MTAKKFDISLDIVPAPIYLTLSPKGYTKALKAEGFEAELSTPGRTSILKSDGVLDTIIVYINNDTSKYGIYDLKGLLVHELNHVVTELFLAYKYDCDETRSYMLQCLYVKAVKLMDKEIARGAK